MRNLSAGRLLILFCLFVIASVGILGAHLALNEIYIPQGAPPFGASPGDVSNQHIEWFTERMFRVYSMPLRVAAPWLVLLAAMILVAAKLAGAPNTTREVMSAWLILPAVALIAWTLGELIGFVFDFKATVALTEITLRYTDYPDDFNPSPLWVLLSRTFVHLFALVAIGLLSFPFFRWGAGLSWFRAGSVATVIVGVNIGLYFMFREPFDWWFNAMMRG